MRRALFVLVLALGCAAAFAVPITKRVIRLSMMEGSPLATTVPAKILHDAYGRLGYHVEITPMPFARSLAAADQGVFDGELSRLPQIEETTSHLIRVPFPIGRIDYVLYALNPINARLGSWKAIQASGLQIGVRQGARLVEASVGKERVTLVNSYESLFQMLLLKRIDVLIAPRGQLDISIALLPEHFQASALKIHQNAPFTSEPLYHYLHERNASLVDPLAAELQRMDKSGVLARLQVAN